MIEGLKIDVSSEELKKHVQDRATYHKEKSDWYATKAKEIGEMADPESAPGGYTSNNVPENMRNSGRGHAQKSGLFQFLADHVVANETYRLTENDLTRLEIISGFGF